MKVLNDTEKYLAMIAGNRPGDALINVRWRKRTPAGVNAGMASSFHQTSEQPDLARRLIMLGQHTDVYVGVALRHFYSGSRRAVDASHLVWCEIDQPDAELLLGGAPVPPSMVLASGGRGRAHAYWQLRHPSGVGEIEAANRALAAHLKGDPVSTDIARLLRPAGTVNHKRCPLTPVRLLTYEPTRTYALADVVRDLSDPKAEELSQRRQRRAPPTSVTLVSGASSDQYEALKAIPPPDWVHALTGEQPNADGKVHCPKHPDQTPSLHLYNDGAWCFAGCGPVDIFDYAAATWLLDTRTDFVEIKRRLAHLMLSTPRARSERPTLTTRGLSRPLKDGEQLLSLTYPSDLTQGAEL